MHATIFNTIFPNKFFLDFTNQMKASDWPKSSRRQSEENSSQEWADQLLTESKSKSATNVVQQPSRQTSWRAGGIISKRAGNIKNGANFNNGGFSRMLKSDEVNKSGSSTKESSNRLKKVVRRRKYREN